MSIYYAIVARGSTVLVDFTEHSGNFQQITMAILQKIDISKDAMTSYSSGEHLFHIITSDGLVYLCLADESYGKSIPYAYLNEIKKRFLSGNLGERAKHCNAYELKRDFAPVMSGQMKLFNKGGDINDPNNKVTILQHNVNEVKSVVTDNIGKILERGEKLEILLDKTEDLNQSSETFVRSTRKLHRKMWWQDKKMCIIITVVVILILGAVTIAILITENVI